MSRLVNARVCQSFCAAGQRFLSRFVARLVNARVCQFLSRGWSTLFVARLVNARDNHLPLTLFVARLVNARVCQFLSRGWSTLFVARLVDARDNHLPRTLFLRGWSTHMFVDFCRTASQRFLSRGLSTHVTTICHVAFYALRRILH